MRFHKNKQAEMIHGVSYWLKQKQDALSAKVPALRDFITEFIAMEKNFSDLKNSNPAAIKRATYNKESFKAEFADVTMKLLSVVKAANFKSKNEQPADIHYTSAGLNRLTAEKLCQVYLKAYDEAKKIKTPQYFGLTPRDIQETQVYYKEFAAVKNVPALRKKEVASKNHALNEAVSECIVLLKNSIDPLMILAAEGNRELRMKYKSLRKVLPKGQGRPSDIEAAYRKSRKRKPKK